MSLARSSSARPVLRPVRLLPWLLAAATIAIQITWVLMSGSARDRGTVLAVILFFATSLSHALATRGWRWTTVFFGCALAFGLLVEALGLATGVPFGRYDYGDRLGIAVLGVPLLIPLAWAMIAYPCFVVAVRATRTSLGAIVLAGGLLAAWDLFLDPQMVAEGHWTFADPSPALPGSTGTPIVNHVGWVVAGLVLMAVEWFALTALAPPATRPEGRRLRHAGAAAPVHDPDIALPAVMLAWVYLSNVLANAAFLGRPVVALVGGIGMGIPLAFAAAGLARPRLVTYAAR